MLHFPSAGCFWAALHCFTHKIEEAAVSNRQFLNWLAASEIKFQPITCSRHSPVVWSGLQLPGDCWNCWLGYLDLVAPSSWGCHKSLDPTRSSSPCLALRWEADSASSAWADHLLRLNHVWGRLGMAGAAELICSSPPVSSRNLSISLAQGCCQWTWSWNHSQRGAQPCYVSPSAKQDILVTLFSHYLRKLLVLNDATIWAESDVL